MTSPRTVDAQLAQDLGAAATARIEWLGDEVVETVRTRAEAVAADVARDLLTGEPEERRAAAGFILTTVWPNGEPPTGWWRTLLGRTVAGLLAETEWADRHVSAERAAGILGVSRATVYNRAQSGEIRRAEDGRGFHLGSVLAHVADTGG